MMDLPQQTNIPHKVDYDIIIDSVETSSTHEFENVIESVNFHINSMCNDIRYTSEIVTCSFDDPSKNDFKPFSEFTKAEIVAILERKCFDKILVIKSKLNSKYYITKKLISSDDLPWS